MSEVINPPGSGGILDSRHASTREDASTQERLDKLVVQKDDQATRDNTNKNPGPYRDKDKHRPGKNNGIPSLADQAFTLRTQIKSAEESKWYVIQEAAEVLDKFLQGTHGTARLG